MPTAWRLVRDKYADSAFSGEGAWLYGGRWDSQRVRLVYASATLSLAALEILVHVDPYLPLRYVAFPIEIPTYCVERVNAKTLPPEWRDEPPSLGSQVVGNEWAHSGRTAVLAVPSNIVPGEWNYLLNTAHADYHRIEIGKPQAFAFDPRLLTRPH